MIREGVDALAGHEPSQGRSHSIAVQSRYSFRARLGLTAATHAIRPWRCSAEPRVTAAVRRDPAVADGVVEDRSQQVAFVTDHVRVRVHDDASHLLTAGSRCEARLLVV